MDNYVSFLEAEENNTDVYTLERDKNGKVIISSDNVSKVFAMMAESPQYKKATRINDNKSSAYLFYKWKKNHTINEEDLLELLSRLNKENSTRVSGNDLEAMRDIIVDDLISVLSKLEKSDYSIISTIISKCDKTPFSFATKFCHYACMFLLDGEERDNFPIFDVVMRKNLGKYSETWENAYIEGKKSYLKNVEGYSSLSSIQLIKMYESYAKAISELAKMNNVSKTGVEQLIWYYHNGD